MGVGVTHLATCITVIQFSYQFFNSIECSEFNNDTVHFYWRDLKLLFYATSEFSVKNIQNTSHGVYNVFPSMVIDMEYTAAITDEEKYIFKYAAHTNEKRLAEGATVETVQLWISTYAANPNYSSIFFEEFIPLSKEINEVFPGTVRGFVIYPYYNPNITSIPNTNATILEIIQSNLEVIGRKLLDHHLSLQVVFPSVDCVLQSELNLIHGTFSVLRWDTQFCQEILSTPNLLPRSLQEIQTCPVFSPQSTSLVVYVENRMVYFPFNRTGSLKPNGLCGSFTHFKSQTSKLLNNASVTYIPRVVVDNNPSFELSISEEDERKWLQVDVKFQRDYFGFSVYFDKPEQNMSALLPTLIPTAPKIAITNFYKLTTESIQLINSTLDQIINFKATTASDPYTNFADTKKGGSIPIEVSILLRSDNKYVNTESNFIHVLHQVYSLAVEKNRKSIKTVAAVVVSNFVDWKRMLTNFSALEEQYQSEREFTPKLGIALNVDNCNPFFLDSYLNSLKEIGIIIKIWLEDIIPPEPAGTNRINVLQRLNECHRVFKAKDLDPANKMFYLITIFPCHERIGNITGKDELYYGMVLEEINDLIYEKQIPTMINTAFEYTDFPKIGEIDPELRYKNNNYTANDKICGWWNVLNSSDSLDDILESKQTIARKLLGVGPLTETNESTVGRSYMYLIWVLPLCVIGGAFITGLAAVILIKVKGKNYLPTGEMLEFYNGSNSSEPATTGTSFALALKYDKERYELSEEAYEIDKSNCLGSGEFGIVYSACLKDGNIPLAVKTLKKRSRVLEKASLPALRGLLSEIKILSYLGDYKHIVKFYGANTQHLRSGNVLVFLEMCDLGSLESFLRNVTVPKELHDEAEVDEFPLQEHESVNNKELQNDLLRWAEEIVSGMEYIVSKQLVHADLATRNVLLDSNKTAKIADFGLSRRLYEYTHYVKTSEDPLPWRWMAPEALRKNEFCEKTDVWAFGVTLWEIYSLGDTPYPGLVWDVNFPDKLENGLKLAIPTYCSVGMYNVMLQCWKIEPELRLTFSELKESIARLSSGENLQTYISLWENTE